MHLLHLISNNVYLAICIIRVTNCKKKTQRLCEILGIIWNPYLGLFFRFLCLHFFSLIIINNGRDDHNKMYVTWHFRLQKYTRRVQDQHHLHQMVTSRIFKSLSNYNNILYILFYHKIGVTANQSVNVKSI